MQQNKYDLYQRLNYTFNFDNFNPSHSLFIPHDNREEIQDIYLRIWLEPASVITSFSASPEKIRIYAAGRDLTQDLLKELSKIISNHENQSDILNGYANGMDYWYKIMEKTLPDSHRNSLRTLRNRINSLKQLNDISDLFSSFGQQDDYVGGVLHPANFLYKFIPISRISLRQVLEHHNLNLDNEDKLYVRDIDQVMVSHGAHYLFNEDDFSPEGSTGTIQIELDIQSHNRLQDKIETLETQFRGIQSEILDSLEQINFRLSEDGELRNLAQDIDYKQSRLELSLNTAGDKLEDYERQIRELKSRISTL